MLTAEQGTYVDIADVRTFYVKLGEGPALVLIHSSLPGACALVDWACNFEYLAEAGFTVYGFDQPGYGRSSEAPEPSIEYLVAHALGFVNAMELDSYAVMGASHGAYVAARLAVEDARAERLLVVAPGTLAPPGSAAAEAMARQDVERVRSYTPSPENAFAVTMHTLYDKARMTADVIRERYLMSVQQRAEAAAHVEVPSATAQKTGARINVPSLILWGAQDDRAAVERSLLLLEAIPGAELHVFDHCGHWVQWDQADRFNQIVKDFLLRA
ncbi:MAG: hypothetical protein A3F84_18970 [Candidatus Handelsmanbacteria bacterium RIFCSPLOWO2_12_FULL_64_10]|uniref:AB hydrolase-1 domain-containing protein n=1 Tax=Handelsmanbacteria sp. (strain RIFCSPLOWO2_12_FULL_64_10) TaxID=1817868 RepID=A0A1F6D4J9_HANXR|nr:MAG: hypothetical protein A3F84_18970 [Candidatus Handelsmanbacteria bacterium RIFCSPLOWO2_12_FULL_64_10]